MATTLRAAPPTADGDRAPGPGLDLSVVIPARDEAENLGELLPQLHAVLGPLALVYEVLVVDERPSPLTRAAVAAGGATLLSPSTRGYGRALAAGFAAARGRYVATMDADQSHPPAFLADLWAAREVAEVVIASRYVPGGSADMPSVRFWLSRVLNRAFGRGLALAVEDMSSGFRLYDARVLRSLAPRNADFDILEELLVKALMAGHRVREVPFDYRPRRHGASNARVVALGLAYLRTFGELWRLRNSIGSADYDARAYDSVIPPQRYWQRQRFRHVVELVAGEGPCLDVGCGSSRILGALPPGSVAVDILLRKLRYDRVYPPHRVQASVFALPVTDGAFASVLCSQVIEHVPRENALAELDRVLAPGGRLVLGTPDYGHWQWRVTEAIYGRLMPHAYADEHITRYTRAELLEAFVAQRGYALEDERYILQGELILALRKPHIVPNIAPIFV